MKILPVQQHSLEWMVARAGIPTASEFGALLTPGLQPRKGLEVKGYLAKKVAERWIGGPLAGFNSFDMDQGSILEDQAVPEYELRHGADVQRVGLITTDDGRVGASPDGLIGDHGGIEVKCPAVHTHVQYLLAGVVPKEYVAQVQGGLWVSGRERWTFLSHRRHFPPLEVVVERDEKVMATIGETLELFLVMLDRAYDRLCDINGGPPVKRPFLKHWDRQPDPAWVSGAPESGPEDDITP